MAFQFEESGQEFELRALNIARAIHDPSGAQGSTMHAGKERDGVFISYDAVNVYEFTVDGKKAKAEKDASKIVELIGHLSSKGEHRFKTFTGWFVTRDEPTAEQRDAVSYAKQGTGKIHAISVATLYQRLCDTESYLQRRVNAPFGSVSYLRSGSERDVPIHLSRESGQTVTVSDASTGLQQGKSLLITGDFGIGKSHVLRNMFRQLRKMHFKTGKLAPFPLHINLRDCAGLKTPSEILRRHAESIGFENDMSLVSAWRAGRCIVLLDGFDEVIPSRWLGNAADVRSVRWEALSAVRKLISETPQSAGVVVCGRTQYFSSGKEMLEALGMRVKSEVLTMSNFTEDQVTQYLSQSGVGWALPDWVPSRPLLIGYLVQADIDGEFSVSEEPQGPIWLSMFDSICNREAQMFTAVRPEVIKQIVARVATLARSKSDVTGPIGMEELRRAYTDVNGIQPDEEGLQVLLRLPGLSKGDNESSEDRVFVDQDLATTAYGVDLAGYLTDPYGDHPLGGTASWAVASSILGTDASAHLLAASGMTSKSVEAVAKKRQNQNQSDAVLADTLRVAESMMAESHQLNNSYAIDGVIFESITLGDAPLLDRTVLSNCLIQRLDATAIDEHSTVPFFSDCVIGTVEGWSSIPGAFEDRFPGVEIETFSPKTETTSGIVQLKLPDDIRVALTVLKKVYAQSGSGRKEAALSRGLPPHLRELVSQVIARLIADGWLEKPYGTSLIYRPVRGRRPEARAILESPATFRLS